MNVYTIHLRSKKVVLCHALSYSEDTTKFLFHKKEDQSDSDSWFWKDDVVGIDNGGEEPGPLSIY